MNGASGTKHVSREIPIAEMYRDFGFTWPDNTEIDNGSSACFRGIQATYAPMELAVVAALPHHRVTVEEYLRLDRDSEVRNEFYGGQVYAMSGASERHILIVRNLVAELRSALRNTQCRPYMTDMRVRVSPQRLYAYPDVVVACGERQFASDQRDTLLNPTVIIEVLSPSTEGNDRGFKAAHYRALDSLREYLVVSQNQPRIEVYRRHEDGRQWILSDLTGLDSVCRFESLDCEIPFGEIYRDVEFDPQPGTS